MIKDEAWKLFPDTFMCHYAVANILNKHIDCHSVVDIGGNGRLSMFTDMNVVNANITNGIDGQNLPYKDQQFDASVSINTLEHVQHKDKFIKEALRVAKFSAILCFSFNGVMAEVDVLKRSMNHKHPMNWGIPDLESLCKVEACHEPVYCMPSWLHLSFIAAGSSKLNPKVSEYINRRLVDTNVWFTDKKDACGVIVEFYHGGAV